MDFNKNITFLDRIRHHLNPLHIYCRLTCLGISSKMALGICKVYETSVYRTTLGK
jgi:hypothetical protein